jgi:hypothetical protein
MNKPMIVLASVLVSIAVMAFVVLLNYLTTTYVIEVGNSDSGFGLVYEGLKSVAVVILALFISTILFIRTIRKR